MSSVIKTIEKNSPLRKKAKPGDTLLSINGNSIVDVLDYKYYSYDARLAVTLQSADGKKRIVGVKKGEGEELGLEFETYLMDRARSCANKCVFCFVDQLPEGMRPTLYFKDDDARLSFLTGNYITLTNISERELQRIIDLKISPINVSVHATNPQLRALLLGCRRGAKGMEQMRRLAAGGITMNCQIVCCPGLNDGEELSRSMTELSELYPQVRSVSIVPVGLTKYREGLHKLTAFDAEQAKETLELVEDYGRECIEKHGSRIFFCSDELYLKAEKPIPAEDWYEGYPQIENGVGLLRSLHTEFMSALKWSDRPGRPRSFSIATGMSAFPFMEKLVAKAKKMHDNIDGRVYPVLNDFFGHTIDVAGLITGGDLINQLRGKELGEMLLLPLTMLRHGEGVFLDDITLEEVERELGVPVHPVGQDGGELLDAMLGV